MYYYKYFNFIFDLVISNCVWQSTQKRPNELFRLTSFPGSLSLSMRKEWGSEVESRLKYVCFTSQDQPFDHWPNIVSILLDRVNELNSTEKIVYFFDNVSGLWKLSYFLLSLPAMFWKAGACVSLRCDINCKSPRIAILGGSRPLSQ